MIENSDKALKKTLVLVYLIGFCFLWEQCKRISFPSSSVIVPWIRIAQLILLGAVLFQLPWRNHRWYLILILAVVLIIVTAWYRSRSSLSKTRDDFSKIILVLLLCPAIGILIQGKNLKTFLQVLTAVWTITYVVLSILAIYAVTQNTQIVSYNGKQILGLNSEHYLLLWDSQQNMSGHVLALSIMVAYIGAAISERRWVSVLYLAAAFIMLISLAMTNSRAGIISMWIGSGAAIVTILWKPLGGYIRKQWLKWLASLLLVVVVTALGLLCTAGLRRGVNSVIRQGGVLVHSAKAETVVAPETETTEKEVSLVAEKDVFFGVQADSFLTSREDLWLNVLRALKIKPSLLLTGTSINTVMEDLSKLVPTFDLPQLHNEFLQVLVSTGIIGLILFIAFLYYALRASFRLFLDTERPLWERLLFLPFLCVLLIDQVEALRITVRTDLLGLMMIYTGAAIVISGRAGEKQFTQ